MQTINTLTDNFLWEKNETFVTVITPGLYEISFGMFSKKKPNAQLLVNGEPVVSAVNSTSYAVHHSSGKLKDVKNSNTLNSVALTGLTFFDYLILPARSRLSISYICDTPGEGFICLKRVQ